LELFSKSPHLVSCQLGISCTDDSLRAILEPGAAAINQRLDNLKNLHSLGIDIVVRANPLIYNVTDSDTQVRQLCSRISPFTSSLALSYLFLRPAIRQSIEQLPDKSLVYRILEPYKNACRLKIGPGSSQALTLPAHIRSHAFDRITKIANEFGITTHPCSCKNHDITSDYCRISKPLSQPGLFEQIQI
jgi:DNA repair photolyase